MRPNARGSLARSAATAIGGLLLSSHQSALAQAAEDTDSSLVAIAIVVAVVLFVIGLIVRGMMSTPTPKGWQAFIARRHAEGRSTRWTEWRDDERD